MKQHHNFLWLTISLLSNVLMNTVRSHMFDHYFFLVSNRTIKIKLPPIICPKLFINLTETENDERTAYLMRSTFVKVEHNNIVEKSEKSMTFFLPFDRETFMDDMMNNEKFAFLTLSAHILRNLARRKPYSPTKFPCIIYVEASHFLRLPSLSFISSFTKDQRKFMVENLNDERTFSKLYERCGRGISNITVPSRYSSITPSEVLAIKGLYTVLWIPIIVFSIIAVLEYHGRPKTPRANTLHKRVELRQTISPTK
ncbi:hypothetical protein SNEBB_001725 [Seison nebaliae]|nr:hypothetical protein SNEBB_001725 [Seison nebaliae]